MTSTVFKTDTGIRSLLRHTIFTEVLFTIAKLQNQPDAHQQLDG